MKSFKITVPVSWRDKVGRIPTPPKGSVEKPKRGKGAYKRHNKHKDINDEY